MYENVIEVYMLLKSQSLLNIAILKRYVEISYVEILLRKIILEINEYNQCYCFFRGKNAEYEMKKLKPIVDDMFS